MANDERMSSDASASKRTLQSPQADTAAASMSNVVLALTLLDRLGGAERFVDIEEVALEAFKLAPDRFGWRTRRDLPSWERVRTAFVHANQEAQKRETGPVLFSNKEGEAWRLTAQGVKYARENAGKIQAATGGARPTRRGGASVSRVRQIRNHPAFRRFMQGTPVAEIERYQLADLLLCPPDSPVAAVMRKVDTAEAAAVDVADEEVQRFLGEVENEVERKWY
jgi:hypothetical protein